jgi:LysR family transcriptional regulator, transcriptional activator for dmlA
VDLPDIDNLQFFHGIARASTLTEAARHWGVSTSAVSKRLAYLENRLGVQLVNRSTRRLTLTDEGTRYAAGAARVLPLINDLEEEVSQHHQGLRGRLAVHSSMGLGRAHLAPLLAQFNTLHPQVEIELELSHMPVHIAGTPFDFAVRVGRQRDSSLRARLLRQNRRVVCASPKYLQDREQPRSLDDLANHDCIVIREIDTDYALWRFGTDMDESAIRVPGSMISNDGEVATQWCIDGHGLLMRSLWHVAPMLRDGSLIQVLDDIPTPSANIYAVYTSMHNLSRRARGALDYLSKELVRRIEAPPEVYQRS